MRKIVVLAATLIAAYGWLPTAVGAQLPSAGIGIDVHDFRLPIALDGRRFSLAARIYRPAGRGPFPLVVINHGTPVKVSDAHSERLGYANAARWFASQGYVVVTALRPGFGNSDGPYMEPTAANCANRNYVRDGEETAAIERAIVESASALPDIDPRRTIVVGQSAGGFGVIALADAPPPGVVAAISFAGGRGGDDHEHICGGAQRLIDAAGSLGRRNRLPQLWLYAANDHFFPPAIGRAMAQAYQSGTREPIRFIELPPFDGDGHNTFGSANPSMWSSPVSQFLAQVARPR